jgi:hypothetical protein
MYTGSGAIADRTPARAGSAKADQPGTEAAATLGRCPRFHSHPADPADVSTIGDLQSMSYDVYFWWQADGHPDDIADALAEGRVEHLTPHPALAQLRRALSERHPHVGDLLEPAAHDAAGANRYLILALPIADAGIADDAIILARSLGITAYDPQRIRAEVAIWAPHRGASPVGHLIVDDVHLDLAGHARSLAQALP